MIFNFSFLTRTYSILDFWQYCNIWGLAKCTWLITNVILHFTVYGSKITYGVQKTLYLLTVVYHRILHTPNKLTLEIPRSFVCLRDSFRGILAGASFQLFLEKSQKKIKFFNATGLLKNWKKQHFILCSNLTLFIVPFFVSFFFLFFPLFFFFSGGSETPSPPQITPLDPWGIF